MTRHTRLKPSTIRTTVPWSGLALLCGLILVSSCAGTLERPPAGAVQNVDCVSELKHLFSFGSSGTMPGQFRSPSSVRIDSFENLLIADTGNNRIQKFDASGRFVMEFGALGSSEGNVNQPTDCVENGLRIYVVDSANERILEFDGDGRFFSVCVSSESLADRFSGFEPRKIAFSQTGYVFVSDVDADALVVFSRFWDPVSVVGGFGAGEGRFREPGGMAVDARGGVIVCDTGNDRLQVLSSTGNFVRGIPACSGLPGCEPVDVAMGPGGLLYVADAGLGRVVVLGQDGIVKCELGEVDGERLWRPRSVAVSQKGLLYVLDGGSDEVHVFQTNSGAAKAADAP
jgi:DNA-binding beta-propeller fold protein YncE